MCVDVVKENKLLRKYEEEFGHDGEAAGMKDEGREKAGWMSFSSLHQQLGADKTLTGVIKTVARGGRADLKLTD